MSVIRETFISLFQIVLPFIYQLVSLTIKAYKTLTRDADDELSRCESRFQHASIDRAVRQGKEVILYRYFDILVFLIKDECRILSNAFFLIYSDGFLKFIFFICNLHLLILEFKTTLV